MTETTTRVWTLEDVRERGTEAVRAEIIAAFETAHVEHPQYAGWADRAVLVTARRTLGGGGVTFVRAEAGEILLAITHRVPWRIAVAWDAEVTVWCPRVGWHVRTDAHDVVEVAA